MLLRQIIPMDAPFNAFHEHCSTNARTGQYSTQNEISFFFQHIKNGDRGVCPCLSIDVVFTTIAWMNWITF